MSAIIRLEHPTGRPVVVVLGMHRSGTSMCAHILSMLGLDMADDPQRRPDALKGLWEREEIVNAHDRILQLLGRDYASPLHAHALAPGWWAEPAVRAVRNELIGWLRHRIGDSPRFGFKDPRTCRALPMWREIFTDLGLEPRYVFCVRDPRQVGRSLGDRDRFAHDDREYRWMVYNAHAVAAVGTAPVCIVPYEAWFTDPGVLLARLAAHTDASMRPDEPELKAAVAGVIDAGLRHDGSIGAMRLNSITQDFYEQLTASAEAGRFTEAAIGLAQHFVGFERLMAPAHSELAQMRLGLAEAAKQLAAMHAVPAMA
ncbi:MAG: hypothetical protein QOD93_328 [Acetobacteraceae bacterium]|nr:hypothetical protein [Rhodopila sp.]MEA2726059.1 hypothetical protein [Acetobacteraceae bacterium]MEA2767366.1 hypothetical protein [Acetobacteraceae bacterium]